MLVRVCRHEEFEVSHMLDNYVGKCGAIHGHTYKVEVTFEGNIIEDPNNNSYGMLMDFNDLKPIIKEVFPDHYYLSDITQENGFQKDIRELLDTYNMPYKKFEGRSTVERMVIYFAKEMQKRLPDNVFVVEIKMWETTNSYGIWRIEDHPSKKYEEFRKENLIYED